MRLIGKLTPKLSLYGTISKTAEVVGSNIQPLTVRNNGTYEASNGVDGFNPIYVNTPEPKEEQTKTLNVDENGFYEVLPDNEKVLYSAKINVNVPPKEEQEKTIDVTENGTTEVLPDENKVLGKVTVNVDVPCGVEEIENLIDESGVLDSTEGSVNEKVEQLIDKAEELGVLHSVAAISFDKTTFPSKERVKINLPNVSNLDARFLSWNNEPLPKVDELILTAPKVKSITSLFYYCDSFKKIVLNLSNDIANMRHAFGPSNSIEEITLYFSTENVTNFYGCFGNAPIKTIKGTLNFSSATDVANMFLSCGSLENVTFEPNTLSISISLAKGSKLTSESIQSIIDGLATVETAQTLTLHADVKAKLTQIQLDTITSKNWNLA